jgi:CHASE3 domain sensor protein
LFSIQAIADDNNGFVVPVSAAITDTSFELETDLLLASTEASLVSHYSASYCDAGDRPGLLGYALHGNDWLTAQYVYTGEVFNNTRGGLTTNNATRYTGRFDMVLAADLDAKCMVPGGRLFFHFQSLYGEGITDNIVGAHQRISNMDGNPGAGFNFSQLTQYWWEKEVVEGLFTVRLGKILADSEFAIATRGGDFINTSLGWTHTIPVLPAYPNSSAAVIGFLQLNDNLELKAGVWDGAPDGGNWGFSGTGDVFTIGQLTTNYTVGCNDLPADMHLGVWHHNGTFTDQGVCLWSVSSLIQSNGWVDHTHMVIAEAKAIEASAVDMETGMRGYLLAGEDGFLDPYNQGGQKFAEILTQLKETVNDNPEQVKLLEEIESNIAEWKANVTEPTIQLRREIGDAETMNDMAKLVGEAKGKVYFDKFRQQIATFEGRERALMKQRQQAAKDATKVAADSLKTVDQTGGWVTHTYKVIDEAKEILAAAVNMETGMRGYRLPRLKRPARSAAKK